MLLYLLSHSCSDQHEQILQQPSVVLSVQVRQRALLSQGSIWVLYVRKIILLFEFCFCFTKKKNHKYLKFLIQRTGYLFFVFFNITDQLSDQRNSEGRAALPPHF